MFASDALPGMSRLGTVEADRRRARAVPLHSWVTASGGQAGSAHSDRLRSLEVSPARLLGGSRQARGLTGAVLATLPLGLTDAAVRGTVETGSQHARRHW